MSGQFKGEGRPWCHISKGVDAMGFKGREVGIGHADAIVCHRRQAEFAQLRDHRGQQAPEAGRWCTPGYAGKDGPTLSLGHVARYHHSQRAVAHRQQALPGATGCQGKSWTLSLIQGECRTGPGDAPGLSAIPLDV